MANVNNPRGFEPVQPILRMREYTKGTAATAIFYPGDVVGLRPDGLVNLIATATTTIAGVVVGYTKAATTKVLLMDDMDQQYYIKDDGVGATLAQSSVGNVANIVMTTGNATFLKSSQSLDTSTAVATTSATFQLRILGFHPDDEIGKYVRVRVRFNSLANYQERTTGL